LLRRFARRQKGIWNEDPSTLGDLPGILKSAIIQLHVPRAASGPMKFQFLLIHASGKAPAKQH
jgi:hypothetical protein